MQLRKALINECLRMRKMMRYDREGFYYWKDARAAGKFGVDQCGICTNGAYRIAEKFQGYVAGYEMDWKVNEGLVATYCCGHDFAIIGHYLVDWWAWEYDQSLTEPVLHLIRDAKLVSKKYRPKTEWKIHPVNDFRPGWENRLDLKDFGAQSPKRPAWVAGQ